MQCVARPTARPYPRLCMCINDTADDFGLIPNAPDSERFRASLHGSEASLNEAIPDADVAAVPAGLPGPPQLPADHGKLAGPGTSQLDQEEIWARISTLLAPERSTRSVASEDSLPSLTMPDSATPKALSYRKARHTATLNGDVKRNGVRYYEVVVYNGRQQWSIWRRYSRFQVLHQYLRKGDSSLPEMPKKSEILIRASERFRHQRYEALCEVLLAAIRVDPALQLPEVREFFFEEEDGGSFHAPTRRFAKRKGLRRRTASGSSFSSSASYATMLSSMSGGSFSTVGRGASRSPRMSML